jgi:hypothetical protein
MELVRAEQRIDQSHQLAGEHGGPFVGRLRRLPVLPLVELAVGLVAHPQRVGRLTQVVAQVRVAGLGERPIGGVERPPPAPRPPEAGVLGQGGVVGKARDLAELGDQLGGLDGPDSRLQEQGVREAG